MRRRCACLVAAVAAADALRSSFTATPPPCDPPIECALPSSACGYTVITAGDATIAALLNNNGLAIGGDGEEAPPSTTALPPIETHVGGKGDLHTRERVALDPTRVVVNSRRRVVVELRRVERGRVVVEPARRRAASGPGPAW